MEESDKSSSPAIEEINIILRKYVFVKGDFWDQLQARLKIIFIQDGARIRINRR